MRDVEIPKWLKGLPFAPEYRPTDTEFADPIAYISKIEKEASAFGICKVIPPLPKPSKKHVLFNLNNSLSKWPELGSDVNVLDASKTGNGDKVSGGNAMAVFTTRHQELGKRNKEAVHLQPSAVHMQVWQSGEVYTLEQFESKSKAFARSQLGMVKEVSPLVIEALFWKAASEKSIYVEYANDVPGSGFGEPEGQFRYLPRRRKRKKMTFGPNNRGSSDCKKYHVHTLSNSSAKEVVANINISTCVEAPKASPIVLSDQTSEKASNVSNGMEGSAGWKLANSPWNLQVIARSPGSLTRFMPDDIPGVTSPMVYIGMLFSWFAWHVEDHELHSMNFLHTGSSKTWYAVPGDYAFAFEEVIRIQAYGGNIDRLAALSLLGQKTTLFSPEEVVLSGIPCCRLVQNPGEFVVTFPRAYHIGFSHGFNCGEAANFGTPKWLAVAKEAAVRRAAMNYLPMLSHQQLLYLLTMSFFSRIPRSLLPGVRSSRLRDRLKEERELLVKKAFIEDILHENHLLSILLGKNSSYYAVLWDLESLPSSTKEFESCSDNVVTASGETVCSENDSNLDLLCQMRLYVENANDFYVDDYDLSSDFQVDSGTLPCVACGILGFPFMSIVQPSEKASIGFLPADPEMTQDLSVVRPVVSHLPIKLDRMVKVFNPDVLEDQDKTQPKNTSVSYSGHILNASSPRDCNFTKHDREFLVDPDILLYATEMMKPDESSLLFHENRAFSGNELTQSLVSPAENQSLVADYPSTNDLPLSSKIKCSTGWNISNGFFRPRIFCLEHAIQIEELLHSRGGANVLVICHSDFLKIKAHAAAIAEEIGTPFKYYEIPLDNASQRDLNLTNIAIDDEGQDGCEEDWTSKLSINMQHCVKLRKSFQSEEMQHALALQGLFSDSSSSPDSSKLNWLSRKSRSKRNQSHPAQGKPSGSLQVKKNDDLEVKSDSQMARKENKLIQYSRRKFQSKTCNTAGARIASRDPEKHIPSSLLAVYCKASGRSWMDMGQCDRSENENTRYRIFASTLQSALRNDTRMLDISRNLSESSVQSQEVPSLNANLLHENVRSFKPKEMTLKNPGSDCTEDDYQIHQGFNFNEESSHKSGKCFIETCDSQAAVAVQGSEIKEIETENKIIDELSMKNKHQNLATADCCGIKPSEDVLMKGTSYIAYSSGPTANDLDMKRVSEQNPRNDELADIVFLDNDVQRSQTTVASIENKPAPSSATLESLSTLLDESLEVLGEIHSTEVPKSVRANCLLKNGKVDDVESTNGDNRSIAKIGRKREREVEQQRDLFGINGFIRSPCEGLRPRARKDGSRIATNNRIVENKRETARVRKPSVSQKQENRRGSHRCDIEGCRTSFQTKGELHKLNRCPHKGCGKKFTSYKYAIFHQRVHDDDRPLKCTWKGCSMSFKWAWARTEHLRVHTGERPYECKYEECGRTFRFVSDFSRHRRKTGHYVNLPT